MGHPASRVIGDYDFADFAIAPDGAFDIANSAREQPGNWMGLDPECDRHFILVRRFMGNPSHLVPVVHLTRTSSIFSQTSKYAMAAFDIRRWFEDL